MIVEEVKYCSGLLLHSLRFKFDARKFNYFVKVSGAVEDQLPLAAARKPLLHVWNDL